MWIRFIWLTVGQVGDCFEHGTGHLGALSLENYMLSWDSTVWVREWIGQLQCTF